MNQANVNSNSTNVCSSFESSSCGGSTVLSKFHDAPDRLNNGIYFV